MSDPLNSVSPSGSPLPMSSGYPDPTRQPDRTPRMGGRGQLLGKAAKELGKSIAISLGLAFGGLWMFAAAIVFLPIATIAAIDNFLDDDDEDKDNVFFDLTRQCVALGLIGTVGSVIAMGKVAKGGAMAVYHDQPDHVTTAFKAHSQYPAIFTNVAGLKRKN